MLAHFHPYEPLPAGNFFRYIVLQPGFHEEELKCILRTARIADAQFDSLSYVWGDATRSHMIQCGTDVLRITSSLSRVLKSIRQPDKPVSLWADGICINQDDLAEKGHQVGLMAKIYRAAQRVLIFIGSDDDGQGPAVCSLLNEVDEKIVEISQTVDMSWDSFPFPDEDDPLLSDLRWKALHSLLGQKWFDRGWVVQEAALASDSEVLWGKSRFEWDKLMRVYVWLSTRALSPYDAFVFNDVLINAHKNVYLDTHEEFGRAFHGESAWGSMSILSTLNNAKELDLSDPRDRIYAFLELPQHLDQHVWVKPNYSMSHLEAYRRFATQYLTVSNNVEILEYVSHDETSPFEAPSWIPRWDINTWSLGRGSIASSVSHSYEGTVSEPVVMEDGSLKVYGVIIDKVLHIFDTFQWKTTTVETIKRIWDHIRLLPTPWPYGEQYGIEQLLLEAFFVALSAGTHEGEFSEWRIARKEFALQARFRPPGEKYVDNLTNNLDDCLLEDTEAGAERQYNVFFEFIKNRTHNRRFIVTERGYIGLAPPITRGTDSIGIIFGCKSPCILRGTDKQQYYTYVGATTLIGKDTYELEGGDVTFLDILGEDDSRDWLDWNVEEQDIYLC